MTIISTLYGWLAIVSGKFSQCNQCLLTVHLGLFRTECEMHHLGKSEKFVISHVCEDGVALLRILDQSDNEIALFTK